MLILVSRDTKFTEVIMEVFDKHQVAIAKKTLRMSDMGANIMGGMTKEQAREVLARIAKMTPEAIAKLEGN